ncbi:MAG: tyrosine-type recombinase/integrase [Gammaproteobacteria bacterium]|nr:tyrosine-type recombinase/integrase [Gammaproteobacteria bacterium]
MPNAHQKWVITSVKYLTSQETEALKDHLYARAVNRRGQVTLFIVLLLLGSAMRVSEACDLLVKDTPVGLGENALSVLGKGGRLRLIPILPELAELIKDYVKYIRPSLVCRPMKVRDYDQPLLLAEKGLPMTRQQVYKRIRAAAKAAGITKKIGAHTLRHTYATQFYRKTQDLRMLQQILGHSNINTTTVYAQTDIDKAVDNLKKVFIFNVRNTFSIKCRDKPRKKKKL